MNEHGIRSPFVFDLLLNVIYVKADYYHYKDIEKLREQLLDSDKKISFTDFGASNAKASVSIKKVKDIAQYSAKSAKYAQLLFRLVNHFQPLQVLELGTSLGISTAYLALANSQAKVLTIEGSAAAAELAKQNFEQLQLKNIEQVIGNFDEVLPNVISNCKQLDLVFFDGNHRKEATIAYFNLCLEKATENSVFIIDDIHWSKGMMEAWDEIKANSSVTVTVNLFFMGLVFFKPGQAKQHFVIRF
jgi:predicted O-methyltransferase YrrM